jgi:hypothetical protein
MVRSFTESNILEYTEIVVMILSIPINSIRHMV